MNSTLLARARRAALLLLCAVVSSWAACREPVVPGGDWVDDRGKVVSATEGGIIQIDGKWYMWGIDRSRDNHAFHGINLYVSTDLVHWTYVKQILRRDSDPALDKDAVVERAKILHNKKTGQFVIWMHYEGWNAYSVAEVAWATSDKIDGDFKLQGHYRPMDIDSRDLNVYQDDDGKAYLICTTKGNQNVSLFELDGNYTKIVREVYRGAASNDMECEGHAIVKSAGTYYWMMSWCTGWDFNDNRYFTSKSLAGPWSAGKGLAVSGTHTYESQVGWAFAMPGNDGANFVYMGDRWSVNDFSLSRMVMLPAVVSGGALSVSWMDRWYPGRDSGWIRGEPWFQSGVYKIRSRATGKVLAVPNKTSAARLEIVTDSGTPSQRWKLENLGNSEYRFASVHSGMRMDVSDESREVGAGLLQYAASDKWNQKWHLVRSEGSWWRLVAANTLGKVAEVAGASSAEHAKLALGSYKWADNQEWEIVPVAPLANGTSYHLLAAHSGKALTTTESGMVQRSVAPRAGTQIWKARSLGSGWWAFEQDGKRLAVASDSLLDGAPLALVSDTGAATRWQVVDDGTGNHQIVNGCSGKSLDVDGGATSTADDAKVLQYRNWDTKNQRWTFRETESSAVGGAKIAPVGWTISVHGRDVRVDGPAVATRIEVSDLSGRRVAVVPGVGDFAIPATVQGTVVVRAIPDGPTMMAVLP